MNPDCRDGDGGELRIWTTNDREADGAENGKKGGIIDITLDGGRMVVFWSDEIPHEVLPTAPDAARSDEERDRYALTVWIPTDHYHTIHNPGSKFANLGEEAFPKHST